MADWPGDSEEAVTVARDAMFSVTGGGDPVCTVMISESGILVNCPSFTINWKTKRSFWAKPVGAVKVGFTVVELDNCTEVPPVCCHWKARGVPSGSLLPEPSRTTCAPSFTI
jgi:hypothetical protein